MSERYTRPIGERPAPHVCFHGAMPGKCLAEACENFWGTASFRGVEVPKPQPVKSEPVSPSPEPGARITCKHCNARLHRNRIRRGKEFCCTLCENAYRRGEK